MKRLLFAFSGALLCIVAQAQKGRLFDQLMVIKECNVDITTENYFATTWIELELYNDRNKEAEARYELQLNPGQAITGFQLMLGDKYRDGSIEERWKARNAYNAIVGKKMDPALVQMIGENRYSLNVYPVPAKSSRKVKIKIEQLLSCTDAGYKFELGALVKDSIVKLSVYANIKNQLYKPLSEFGILKGVQFTGSANNYTTTYTTHHIKAPGEIEFLLPGKCNEVNACLKSTTGDFFLKVPNKEIKDYRINIKKLRVYWDCSGSITTETKNNFSRFLKKIIAKYPLDQLLIVPFNDHLMEEKVFSKQEINDERWLSEIEQLSSAGSTQFGILKFDTDDDLIIVFTDGRHTWGKRRLQTIKVPVVFMTTGQYYYYPYDYDTNYYDENGNYRDHKNLFKNVYLYKDKYYDSVALEELSKINISLISVQDEFGNEATIKDPPLNFPSIFIDGKLKPHSKKVIVKYGFGSKAIITQSYDLYADHYGENYEKAKALMNFDFLTHASFWYNTLSFGIENKIVTYQTAYIVLEKIDDYIKYNITPPADLIQECMEKGFVKTDYKQKFKAIQKLDDIAMLKLVSKEYNKRLNIWGANTDTINLTDIGRSVVIIEEQKTKQAESQQTMIKEQAAGVVVNDKSMDEVVVVGYSSVLRKDLTGSVSSISSRSLKDIPFNTSAAEALTGRLAGVQVISNDGAPGAEVQIKIRGGTSLTQSNSPLYIIDGVQVEDGLNSLPISEVAYIDVLKDAGATAIYGARGANGVIVVTTKSGNGYFYNYFDTKLKNRPDIGYMKTIKRASADDKYDVYKKLEKQHKTNMVFFMDMALHFLQLGMKEYADEMLQNAVELGYDDMSTQTAIAFIYEQVKEYDKAINVYKNLIDNYPAMVRFKRDMAWGYYQKGMIDSAIQILYNGIIAEDNNWNKQSLSMKDIMLTEMNMMISLNAKNINVDYIPKDIIKPITTDVRLIIESAGNGLSNLSVKLSGRKTDRKKAKEISTLMMSDYNFEEFQLSNAKQKKYTVSLSTYGNNGTNYPAYVRIIKMIDFGKPTQSIDMDIFSLCNQLGTVEIDDFKLK